MERSRPLRSDLDAGHGLPGFDLRNSPVGMHTQIQKPVDSVDFWEQTAIRRPKRLFSFHGITLNLHGMALKLHGMPRFLHGSIFRLSPLFFFFL